MNLKWKSDIGSPMLVSSCFSFQKTISHNSPTFSHHAACVVILDANRNAKNDHHLECKQRLCSHRWPESLVLSSLSYSPHKSSLKLLHKSSKKGLIGINTSEPFILMSALFISSLQGDAKSQADTQKWSPLWYNSMAIQIFPLGSQCFYGSRLSCFATRNRHCATPLWQLYAM